jgi:hypothetical protein
MTDEEFKDIELENDKQTELEQPMWEWINLNRNSLEMEFIDSFPREDQPLDDDIPDFLDNHCIDLDQFLKDRWYEERRY